MKIAIIGNTGFVGGFLGSQRLYAAGYNSRNSASMIGQSYDLVVCAGATAVKWKANQDGAADWKSIEALWRNVSKIKAERFVLISTVDIYPAPHDVTENDKPHCIANHSYGINRLALEELVLTEFADKARVLRLPGLFGDNLRKNVLFDLAHNRLLESIDPRARFQWYGLDRLWSDIDRALEHSSQKVFNLAVEPVATGDIQRKLFPHLMLNNPSSGRNPVLYDMKTNLCSWMGGHNGYLEDADAVMTRMKRWLDGPSPVARA